MLTTDVMVSRSGLGARLGAGLLSAVLFAFASGFVASGADGQTLQESFWTTDGSVRAIVPSGNTVYVGGVFSRVGPATGGGVPLDVETGSPVAGFPKVAGNVSVIVPDGSGGWFIGGPFTGVGGTPRSHLAHILPDLTVSSWSPDPTSDVSAIVVSGSTVYVGGHFMRIGGKTRNRLAAVDAETGEVTAWDPDVNGNVSALVMSGGTIYVGGGFTSVGGQSRRNLAALDASTGKVLDWRADANLPVITLAMTGATLYAGGTFWTIGGHARTGLAALDATTGQVTAWQAGANNAVLKLLLDDGTLFAAGDFTNMGGQARNHLAALDAATGQVTTWDPNPDHVVYGLAVSGTTVYVAGSFTTIGGQPRTHLAALDRTSGQATAWSPPAPNRPAGAMAVLGSIVYAGGSFWIMGGEARNSLAAFDARTGEATDWNPNAGGGLIEVSTIAVSGSTVYVGGYFPSIGGVARKGLAALDARTGKVTAWDARLIDGHANTLIVAGGRVFVGGSFTQIGGRVRANIAALDETTGDATDWDAGVECSWCDEWNVGEVTALESSGGTLFISGAFTSVGGQPRNSMAALDARTGRATAWNPAPSLGMSSGGVRALAVRGSTIYAGGYFTRIGGQDQSHLAALDARTGQVTSWNPNPNSAIWNIAESGSTVYVAGPFTSIGGQPRAGLAALDARTGLAKDWKADLPRNRTIDALAVSAGTVYVGGRFDTVENQPTCGLATFAETSPDRPVVRGSATASKLVLMGSGPAPGAVALRYWVPAGRALLRVYDIRGRQVATVLDGEVPAGWGEVSWDQLKGPNRSLRSGIFFAELEAGGERQVRKLVFVH